MSTKQVPFSFSYALCSIELVSSLVASLDDRAAAPEQRTFVPSPSPAQARPANAAKGRWGVSPMFTPQGGCF